MTSPKIVARLQARVAAAAAKTIPPAMIAEAEALAAKGHVSGWRPVIGWMALSPRRGSFGIRFQAETRVEDLGADGQFVPYRTF